MKVQQQFDGSWIVRDNDEQIIKSFKTQREAWRWVETHELDPLWVKGSRQNRQAIEPHRRQRE